MTNPEARDPEDLEEARRVLDIEACSIQALKANLGPSFIHALDLIQQSTGKVVVSGMGKSGQVGRKIASTLSSTGTPAIFLHPADSSHGDMGQLSANDVVLAISYGGETPELRDLLNYSVRKNIPVVAMTGKPASHLGQAAAAILDTTVSEEACPLGLAPTASSTATLALGDALAMCLLKRRGFKEEDFAEYHPGGQLGRRLLTRVEDVMHGEEGFAVVKPEASMRDVIALMTRKEVRGVAGVIDASENLIGSITDGDLRRRLERSQNPLVEMAKEIMSLDPKTIDASELAEKALFVMEQFSIQNLFVVRRASSHPRRPVGLLHLQDLLKAKLR